MKMGEKNLLYFIYFCFLTNFLKNDNGSSFILNKCTNIFFSESQLSKRESQKQNTNKIMKKYPVLWIQHLGEISHSR